MRSKVMLVITGIFEDGRFIPDEPINIPEKRKVVVTIEEKITEKEQNTAIRNKAFISFMQYKGILPEDFDYKSELSDYRDERHGHIA